MEPIPDEWIDRLFGCMQEFYGQRWKRTFKDANHEAMHKIIWKNGLHGLSYEAIRKTLYHYRAQSCNKNSLPPIVTDFFRIALGHNNQQNGSL